MLSNISDDESKYLKRLDSARKEIKDTLIFQDLNQEDLFVVQASKDKTKFYIQNIHSDPNDPISGMLSCGCPDQKYRGLECKHISKIKIKLVAKTEFNKLDIRSLMSEQAQTDFIILEKWEEIK